MTDPRLAAWHRCFLAIDPAQLDTLLSDEVVFHSPVVFRPQPGKALTAMYLNAAMQVFRDSGFHYVRELVSGDDAVLEFEAELDGVLINGVDMIHWQADGRIDDFKVMVRPWKAMEALRARMAAMLETLGKTPG